MPPADVTVTPDGLVRRAIHAAMRVDRDLRADAAERTRMDEERRSSIAEATREAQRAADAVLASMSRRMADGRVQPASSRGSELRQEFSAAASRSGVPWLPPAATTSDAEAATLATELSRTAAEWWSLVTTLDQHAVLYTKACEAWAGRLFKTRASAPQVTADVWMATFRLDLLWAHARKLAVATVANRVREATVSGDLALEAARAQSSHKLAEGTEHVRSAVHELDAALAVAGSAWTDARWTEDDASSGVEPLIRIGDFVVPGVGQLTVPALLTFPFTSGIAIGADDAHREQAISLVRSLLLRAFVATPPGSLHAKVVDPVGVGQSVADFRHLSDYDPKLMDAKTWTSEREIETVLSELADHLEIVISKYLRGQFQTIDEYNEHAGEVAEPYRLLTVFDYPNGFSDRAAEKLLSLIENGPRCGVYTVLHHSTASADDRGPRTTTERLTRGMQRVSLGGSEASLVLAEPIGAVSLPFVPDIAPPIEFDLHGSPRTPYAARLVEVGAAARAANERPAVVTADSLLPLLARARSGLVPDYRAGGPPISISADSWWAASTAESAVAVLGRSGAQGVTSMRFSSTEVAGGGIVVGKPRSGKSTALHSMILTMSMLYSPDELELYLIDAREGMEFQGYDRLPHARMVSVHSDREFSLSILQSVRGEIRNRADEMKRRAPGASNITEYRRRTGETMSRVVVIFDEFHTLFQEPDRIGSDAFAAFSTIVKQGPGFGIHIVVASQTLSDMPAMDRSTLLLLPQRVAFMCNESDAEIVMGDGHRATRSLSRSGEGVFNPAGVREADNQTFQGMYVESDEERPRLVKSIVDRAAAGGFTRLPRVFDGERNAERRPQADGARSVGRLTIAIGEPFSLDPELSVAFRRSRAENLLVLGDHAEQKSGDFALRGVLHSALLAAEEQEIAAFVVDFDGEDELRGVRTLRELAEDTGARYARSRRAPLALDALATEVESRHEESDFNGPAMLMILFGLERAAGLVPFDPDDLDDERVDDDERRSAGARLARILRDGAEVGVHVIVSADTARTVERYLGRDLVDEFNHRVAGAHTDQGDLMLITGEYEKVTFRPMELFVANRVRATAVRVRAYDVISESPAMSVAEEEQEAGNDT